MWRNLPELIFMALFPLCLSCECLLLGKAWEADWEACRPLIQSLQLREPRGSPSAGDERQMDGLVGATCAAAAATSPESLSENERKSPGRHSKAGSLTWFPLLTALTVSGKR